MSLMQPHSKPCFILTEPLFGPLKALPSQCNFLMLDYYCTLVLLSVGRRMSRAETWGSFCFNQLNIATINSHSGWAFAVTRSS